MRFAPRGRPTEVAPPVPPPETAPTAKLRLPWRPWAVLAGFVVLAGAVAYLLLRPAAPLPTVAGFEKSVETYLRKRPPDPTAANVAFAVIQPSLVVIQAQGKSASATGLGAGIIVDDQGTILTCLHVVAGSEGIRLTFSDGFETNATLVSAQLDNDLAVLKPEVVPEDLVPATFGSSADLRLGDPVVAVGNPFGLIDSVSEGVVSGLGRTTRAEGGGAMLQNLIQFDAAVNPGNSGGPLLNRRGEVVGLVSALLNPVQQGFFVGIGYAVTIEAAGRALFDIPPW